MLTAIDPGSYETSLDMLGLMSPRDFHSHPADSVVSPDMSSSITAAPHVDHELQTMLSQVADRFPDLNEIQDLYA